MKKFLFSLTALFLCMSFYAKDFGGTVSNDSVVKGNKCNSDDMKLDQTNTARIWFRTPLSEDGLCYFVTEGLLKYEHDFGKDTTVKAVDATTCKIVYSFDLDGSNKLSLSAGRFTVSDLSAVIFNQACDGIDATLYLAGFNVHAYAGYTGLLNAETVTILNGPVATFTYDDKKFYDANAKYLPLGISVIIPSLFLNQTVSAEGWGFFDLSGDTTTYNRYYATLGLNGPLAGTVFYSLSSSFEKIKDVDDPANLTKASVSMYPGYCSSSITVRGLYASGKQNSLSAFTGFTSKTATLAYDEPEYTGLTLGGISGTIKPVDKLLLSAGTDIVYACPESTFKYDGFQWTVNASYQILSDVQLGAGAFQYYADSDKRNKTSFSLKAVIAF